MPNKRKNTSKTKREWKNPFAKLMIKQNAKFALLWFFGGIGFILFLSTAPSRNAHFECNEVRINIDQNETERFVTESEIFDFVTVRLKKESNSSVLVQNIELDAIENELAQHPYIKSVESHIDIHGSLYLNLNLQEPLARIFPENGESYYINRDGYSMPAREGVSARVLVLSGPFKTVDQQVDQDLVELVTKIDQNPFLKAMIEQVSVNKNQDLVLTTKLGNQEIIFGTATDISEKLLRLETYYKKALAKSDWSSCKSLSLSYKNQIICSKQNP